MDEVRTILYKLNTIKVAISKDDIREYRYAEARAAEDDITV